MDQWKPIEGYEGLYLVHPSGKVKSTSPYVTDSMGRVYQKKGKLLKARKFNTTDYMYVRLKRPGEDYKPTLLHRIVAKAFVPNPEDKPDVNHKDGDKSNNDVSNLEWVTRKENYAHAVETGLMDAFIQSREDRKKAVDQYKVNGTYVRTFSSVTEAAQAVGGTPSLIAAVCRGRQHRHKNYRWAYTDTPTNQLPFIPLRIGRPEDSAPSVQVPDNTSSNKDGS